MSNTRPKAVQIVLTPPDAASPVSMGFVHIPACRDGFLMGSRGYSAYEEPIHRVVISEDFWLGETPVTQAQFDVWKQLAGIEHEHEFSGHPDHPAESMTWFQAMEFCRWLTDTHSDQFPSDFRFAELPCEARWEYACRAGTTTEFYCGDGDVALWEVAWYREDWDSVTTHPCGQKNANNFGLFDMHGNVEEWCLDLWDEFPYRRRWDGITDWETYQLNEKYGHKKSDSRVLRGGSFRYSADWCRSACRVWSRAGYLSRDAGFRVCLVCSPVFRPDRFGEADES